MNKMGYNEYDVPCAIAPPVIPQISNIIKEDSGPFISMKKIGINDQIKEEKKHPMLAMKNNDTFSIFFFFNPTHNKKIRKKLQINKEKTHILMLEWVCRA